jgi:transcriptional/translational regulatory protein YebC/TACO1
MANLWKMPDLAEAVANYQPEPDPVQQELARLAVEKAKLENALLMKDLEDLDSKIFERMSRTEDNQVADAKLKEAKSELAIAQAEKVQAEADLIDQEFIDKDSGKTRMQDIEDQEFEANTKLAEANNKAKNDAMSKIVVDRATPKATK